LSNRY